MENPGDVKSIISHSLSQKQQKVKPKEEKTISQEDERKEEDQMEHVYDYLNFRETSGGEQGHGNKYEETTEVSVIDSSMRMQNPSDRNTEMYGMSDFEDENIYEAVPEYLE